MDKNKPWEETDFWKNQSQYVTWLSGQFRKVWTTHPVRLSFVKDNLINVTAHERAMYGLSPRTRKAFKCACCKRLFPTSAIQVDHIDPVGPLIYEDIQIFMFRLFCPQSNLQLLCKPCHDIKTYAERHGLTLEDANKEKQAIAFSKWPTDKQIGYIEDVLGYSRYKIKNKAMRREIYRKSLD